MRSTSPGSTPCFTVSAASEKHPSHILSAKWQGESGAIIAPRIGCVSTDSYQDLWRKAFREINYTTEAQATGLRGRSNRVQVNVGEGLPEKFTADEVRRLVSRIGAQAVLVLIFDEFDTLGAQTRKAMAETVKLFSDYNVHGTLIFVGVADDVGELLRDHRSIERALIQVPMPRMSDDELMEIVQNGMAKLSTTIDLSAALRITSLSRGLPHYTHLLSLHAVRSALSRASTHVEDADVEDAVRTALKDAQQSTIEAYIKATESSQRVTLYKQVLLACALSETNPLGYFTAAAVSAPLSAIMGKKYEIPSYARHLNEFCDDRRGHVLVRIGEPRNHRFRFANPLMQPFVILEGHASKLVPDRQ